MMTEEHTQYGMRELPGEDELLQEAAKAKQVIQNAGEEHEVAKAIYQ